MGEKEKKYGIIYKATNVENGKVYIGKSARDMEKRRRQHITDARNGSDVKFHRAIRKYGADKFIWSVIDTADTAESLNEKEVYWIAFYNSFKDGYNSTGGGDGVGSGENHPMYGKEHTEEARKKISATHKGRKLTEEHKRNIKKSVKKTMSDKDFLARRSEANKGEKNPCSKLTTTQLIFIRALTPVIKTNKNRKRPYSQREIADWFNIGRPSVTEIINVTRWKHLPTFEQIRDIWRELMNNDNGAT